jgi:hypothetical protein
LDAIATDVGCRTSPGLAALACLAQPAPSAPWCPAKVHHLHTFAGRGSASNHPDIAVFTGYDLMGENDHAGAEIFHRLAVGGQFPRLGRRSIRRSLCPHSDRTPKHGLLEGHTRCSRTPTDAACEPLHSPEGVGCLVHLTSRLRSRRRDQSGRGLEATPGFVCLFTLFLLIERGATGVIPYLVCAGGP